MFRSFSMAGWKRHEKDHTDLSLPSYATATEHSSGKLPNQISEKSIREVVHFVADSSCRFVIYQFCSLTNCFIFSANNDIVPCLKLMLYMPCLKYDKW